VCTAERAPAATPSPQESRPPLEVADVFRAHGETYRQRHALTLDQLRVMRDIETCRTAVLGGHAEVCPECGFARLAYNSCRNRHCPKCQALAQARWIEQRMARVLPTHHFHVVFTLPSDLRPLCMRNPRRIFDLLFASASRTLLKLGEDDKRLGAQLGFTAVLHTWTRSLEYHPHLHCIVTAGGLSADGQRWIPTSGADGRYLFPARVLGDLFRGIFLDGLRTLYDRNELSLGDDDGLASPSGFARFIDGLYRKKWLVYAKRPFSGPKQVYRYLGRYTHRVGISNHRLRSFDERGVCFATKNGKTVTLAPEEFIRRFLMHVLPRGFVKIRHYGLLAPCHVDGRLELARLLLDPTAAESAPPSDESPAKPTWTERLFGLTGVDPLLCPHCGKARLVAYPLHLWAALDDRGAQQPPHIDTS